MEMVIGFAWFNSEWPHKYSRTERGRNRSVSLDRPSSIQIRVANPVNICGRSPGVNAFCAANLMRRRTIPAICADENRAIEFSAKIFQEPRQQNDSARHVMRKLAQQQSRFTTINEHQFR